jgi:dephospho-CoA kinase
MAERKLVIGLIGDACAGKSTLAGLFAKKGATVYDADASIRALYEVPEVIKDVQHYFGKGVLDENGKVDRKKLGAIVFSHPEKMRDLTNRILYPRTRPKMDEQRSVWALNTASPVFLMDAPTLFEAGMAGECGRILYLTAPRERRIEWAVKREWDAEELDRRDKRLAAFAGKKDRADAIVTNDGSVADLEKKVDELWEKWVRV